MYTVCLHVPKSLKSRAACNFPKAYTSNWESALHLASPNYISAHSQSTIYQQGFFSAAECRKKQISAPTHISHSSM